MTKPLNFLIDAASRYAHQLGDQGVVDDAVYIKLGVELAIEKWGASQKDAKFLRDNTPHVRKGAIPPHEIEWKPERKFGRAVIIVKVPYVLFRMVPILWASIKLAGAYPSAQEQADGQPQRI